MTGQSLQLNEGITLTFTLEDWMQISFIKLYTSPSNVDYCSLKVTFHFDEDEDVCTEVIIPS